jgi:hypothetical protein
VCDAGNVIGFDGGAIEVTATANKTSFNRSSIPTTQFISHKKITGSLTISNFDNNDILNSLLHKTLQ